MVKLLLKKGFQEEFPEEAGTVDAVMNSVQRMMEEPAMKPEETPCKAG